MNFRLVDTRRAAEFFRRYGAMAILAAIVIVSLAGLADLGVHDRRGDATRTANQAVAIAADTARAILDRQQRGLDQLARIAATAPDAATQRFLNQLSSLAPGVRAAAIGDPTGTVELRSDDELDEPILAALTTDAAKEAAQNPRAAMLVTQTLRDGDATLVGLARPWLDVDGRFTGLALVAIDRSALAGIDLVRADGSPLFTGDSKPNTRQVALEGFPLMLRYAPPVTGFWRSRGAGPFVAIAIVGGAAILTLLTLLVGRLSRLLSAAVRQAAVERDLRDRLAATAAAADRTGELNRTKSQFFAQVTHELRTPLNAILGFSETIRQEMFGPVANPRYLEYAGLINDAGSHLLSLINDLLDEARIESGKMEIAPIRVSAPALARSALDLVEPLAEGRDIAVATIGLSSSPDLDVDPRVMKQVLVNLLANAIKYTPPGGRIELRFTAPDDGGLAIEIADTGIGMSAEDLRVAFEPFGRAGGTEARRQQGTGLGLSLARALVRLHGGDLTLASQVNSGTTATVLLPASAVFGRPGANPLEAKTPQAA